MMQNELQLGSRPREAMDADGNLIREYSTFATGQLLQRLEVQKIDKKCIHLNNLHKDIAYIW